MDTGAGNRKISKKLLTGILISSISFLESCVSLNISLNHSDISSWLNLMPGSSPSFHITGVVSAENNEEFEIPDIELAEVILTQMEVLIYKFKPFFKPVPETMVDMNLLPGEMKEFRFGTESGLRIVPELNSDESIDARLIFKSDNRTIMEYVIRDIRIEKAY